MNIKIKEISSKYHKIFFSSIIVFTFLYLTYQYDYLLFHVIAELFSIVIGFTAFIIAFNSRKYNPDSYLLIIGIAYFFIANADLLHTLSYRNMNLIKGSADGNFGIQFWILARYIESLSLFIAIFFINRKINAKLTFLAYLIISSLLVASIYYWKVFPTCFIQGQGLTDFKIYSEYIISTIFVLAIVFITRKRKLFDKDIYLFLVASMSISAFAEVVFTTYTGLYGIINVSGHFLKIASFYFIYRAIIVSSLDKPFSLLFRNLKQRENELERSKERYKTLLNSGYDVILILKVIDNNSTTILEVNEKASELLGFTKDELLEYNPVLLFQDENKNNAEEHLQKTLKEKYSIFESIFKTKQNVYLDVEISTHLVEINSERIIFLIARDITSRKNDEKELIETNREIRDFAYIVSHDLKSHIVNIRGFSKELNLSISGIKPHIENLLKKEEKDKKESVLWKTFYEDIPESIKYINSSISSVNNFIEAVLKFSRIGRREIHIEQICLNELLKNILNNFAHQIETNDIIIKLEKLPAINTDRLMVEQLFHNIISNAIKYRKSNEKLVISINAEEYFNLYLFKVSDNGIGIKKSNYDKVFAFFRRAGKHDESGEGMGLAYVKAILKRIDGKIWFESEYEKGTTFFITLPK